jgi:hypothetical protein
VAAVIVVVTGQGPDEGNFHERAQWPTHHGIVCPHALQWFVLMPPLGCVLLLLLVFCRCPVIYSPAC